MIVDAHRRIASEVPAEHIDATSGCRDSQATLPPMWKLARGWLLVIPLVYFAANAKFSFQNPGENTLVGGQGGVGTSDAIGLQSRILLVFICSLIAFLVFPHLKKVLVVLARFKVLAILSLLPLLSTAWSIDRTTTLRASLFLLVSTIFAVYFAECLKPEQQIQALWMTGIVVALASVVIALVAPEVGTEHQGGVGGEWQGIFVGKNICARAIFFLLLPSMHLPTKSSSLKIAKLLSIVLLLTLLVMTRSVTAAIITCSYLIFLPVLKMWGKLETLNRLLVSLFTLLAVAAVSLTVYYHLAELLNYFGRNLTFSGRTSIWTAILTSIKKKPLLGYGYNAFWQGLNGESANVLVAVHWITGYAHNGILELSLGLGITSVVLVLLTLANGLMDAARCFKVNRPGYIDLYLTILIYNVMYNFTEASLLSSFNLIWFLYVVACVVLDREARLSRRMQRLSGIHQQNTEVAFV